MYSGNNKMIYIDMKKFKMIDFKHLFYLIREEPYVFVKHVEIENLQPLGSLDIFCFNCISFLSRRYSCRFYK